MEYASVTLDHNSPKVALLLTRQARYSCYHLDVARNLSYIPDSVRRLLPQLRNSEFTRILIVTLPEVTPVHEAARLQEDLKRAGITPYACREAIGSLAYGRKLLNAVTEDRLNNVASRQDGRTMGAVLEVKKEVPIDSHARPTSVRKIEFRSWLRRQFWLLVSAG